MNRKLIVKLEAPELMAAILALAEAFQQNRLVTALPEALGQVIEPAAVIQDIEEKKEAVKAIGYREVKAKLAALIKAGKKDQVTALVNKYGGEKLSELSQDKYIELFNEAGAIQLN